MEILRDVETCRGCRTCEVVCSYHFRRAFSSGGGAIKVSKNHGTGKILWEKDGTCDRCGNEKQPLCVRFCSYEALRAVKRG